MKKKYLLLSADHIFLQAKDQPARAMNKSKKKKNFRVMSPD